MIRSFPYQRTSCLFVFWLWMGSGSLWSQEPPTWSSDVGCIIHNACSSCHNPEGIAPFSLLTYEDVYSRRHQVEEAIVTKRMPPWMPNQQHQRFMEEKFLMPEHITTITNWVKEGAPVGDLGLSPTPPIFEAGQSLKDADITLQIPEYQIPDLPDIDLYRCFVFDNSLATDRFIKTIEILPSDPGLVHHVIVFQDTTGVAAQLDREDPAAGYTCFGGIGTDLPLMIAGWAPGVGPVEMPPGFGVKLFQGAKLVVQVHYPEGNTNKIDRTKINIKFREADEPAREILIAPVLNHSSSMVDGPLYIPAGEIRTFHQEFRMPFQLTLTGVAPHAHLVCESMRSFGVTRQGDTIPFIDIPHWDFEWQGYYLFQKPIVVPAGTTYHGIATYNNTSVNHHLPYDQPRNVFVGEATTDEMMVFFFGMSTYQTGDEHLQFDTTHISDRILECQNSIVTSNHYDALPEIQITPNPTRDEFRIRAMSGITQAIILITDVQGKEVYRSILSSDNQLVKSNLESGIYFVTLMSQEGRSLVRPSKLSIF